MTITYNVPTGGDSFASLQTGGSVRYGIELNGSTGKLVRTQISTFTVSLKKQSSTSGNITATVRNSSFVYGYSCGKFSGVYQ